MYLNDKLYNTLKWIAQFFLPSLATLYFALSAVWGLPYTEEVVGSIVALSVFLGALLGISSMQYKETEYTEAATKGYGALYEANKGLKKGFNPLTMSPKIYELLKWGVLIFLPASGTLYLALSKFWGLPYGQEIVATIAAISAFLGIFLGVSSAKYNKFLNGE